MRHRLPLMLRFSLLLHLAALLLTLARPGLWPWTLAIVIAHHLQLAVIGLWPRSTSLGANHSRLPARAALRGEVVISIDDGPDPVVTPQVLALLAQRGAHAAFFCIGERVTRHPELVRAIAQAGHSIGNHTQRHPLYFSLLGPTRIRREIEGAQRAIVAAGGARPRFFRAPAGFRNLLLDPVLRQLDMQLVSWTRRGFDTVNAEPASVLRRLTRNLRGGDILLLHDGNAARSSRGQPVILEVLPPLLAALDAAGLKAVTLQAAFE